MFTNILETAEHRMVKGRTRLILEHPFFGSLALRMILLEDSTCGTMWIDGISLGYNPDFVLSLSMDELVGVIAHEMLHVACSHHTRRRGREHGKWNISGDYAINAILIENNFVLPKDVLIDSTYFGKSAEKIYAMLPDNQKKDQDQKQDQGNGKSQEKSKNDPSGYGEVRDYPGENGKPTQQEIEQAEVEIRISTIQAQKIAKSAGKLSGSLERFIDDAIAPVVDWRAVLQRFITSIAKNDYSWMKPNPRYMASDLYLPSLYNHQLGKIILAIDTSGSVSQKILNQFSSELQDIMNNCKPEQLMVIYCDSSVKGISEFFPNEEIQLEPKGGGGTRFSPVFDYLEEQGEQPVCLVYLTDGYCRDFPNYEPDYPTLWAVYHNKSFSPPFGEVVEID